MFQHILEHFFHPLRIKADGWARDKSLKVNSDHHSLPAMHDLEYVKYNIYIHVSVCVCLRI